jgi:hypothetical protein
MESVNIKVCGPNHFFHKSCILSWWESATPSLNTCPMDRVLCYGDMRVGQPATDNIEYADFLGYNPRYHDVDFPANGFIGQLARHTAERTEIGFPDYLLQNIANAEVVDHDAVNSHCHHNHDSAFQDAPEPVGNGQGAFDAVHDGDYDGEYEGEFDESDEFEQSGSDELESLRPGENDPFAASIARGLHPTPRLRPFGLEADQEAYLGLDNATHLVGFFSDDEPKPEIDDDDEYTGMFTRLTDN